MLNKFNWILFIIVTSLTSISDTHSNEKKSEDITDSYNYRIKIHPKNDGSLQKIILTEDIYSYSKKNQLQDISVVDKLNNPLPFEIDISTKEPKKLVKSIAIYPLTEKRFLLENTDIVSFQYDQNNRLSQIQSNAFNNKKQSNEQEQVVGYLLDLGAENRPTNSHLVFELSKASNTSFLRFDIDQSNDLKYWHSISRSEVLAQLFDRQLDQQPDQQLVSQHNKINLNEVSSRYLRLKLLDNHQEFSINSVIQEYSETKSSEPIWSTTKLANYNQQAKGYIFDLAQSIAYTHVKVKLPEPPSFIRGKLYSRNGKNDPWIQRNNVNLFHIQVNGKSIIQNELLVDRLRAKQMMIVLDNNYNQSAPKNLSIDLGWAPQELIFFANGNAPYEILVRSSRDDSESMKDPQFISLIKNQLSSSIPLAKFGESRLEKNPDISDDKPLPWSQIFLWAILILGVVVLGLMARSLLRQVK